MARRTIVNIFNAPQGFVYDYKEPRYINITDKDGNKFQEEEHLYAKQLYLGSFDYIDNYKLVEDPKEK